MGKVRGPSVHDLVIIDYSLRCPVHDEVLRARRGDVEQCARGAWRQVKFSCTQSSCPYTKTVEVTKK